MLNKYKFNSIYSHNILSKKAILDMQVNLVNNAIGIPLYHTRRDLRKKEIVAESILDSLFAKYKFRFSIKKKTDLSGVIYGKTK